MKKSYEKLQLTIKKITNGIYGSIFTVIGTPFIIFSAFSPLFYINFKIPMFFSMIIGFMIIFLGNSYLIEYRKKIHELIRGLNKTLESEFYKVDSIDTIGDKLKSIYDKILILYKYLRVIDWFYFDKEFHNQTKIITDEVNFLVKNIINLRSDLSIRLTEQQQSLESAKSEVEKNIKGTTELKQVSELQKMRLDKQIEQFEELQRVLVKV